MSVHDEDPERSTLFQATVSLRPESMPALGELDLDLLPGTEQVNETHASFEVLLRLDQVEELVTAGATVTLHRTIEPLMPEEAVVSAADPLDRLRGLRPYREDRAQ